MRSRSGCSGNFVKCRNTVASNVRVGVRGEDEDFVVRESRESQRSSDGTVGDNIGVEEEEAEEEEDAEAEEMKEEEEGRWLENKAKLWRCGSCCCFGNNGRDSVLFKIETISPDELRTCIAD